MLNTRINNAMKYFERLQYYTLVAFLYEKAAGGYIAERQYYYPLYVPKSEKLKKLIHEKCEKAEYEPAAEEFIVQYGLNKAYCEKIKNSKGFRYMVAVGFHDSSVSSHVFGKDFIDLKIDCENACFSQPVGVEYPAAVKFCGVEKLEKCDTGLKLGDVSIDEIDGLFYNRQEFYFTDDGKILCYITFTGGGCDGNFVGTTLKILCEDILLA